MSVPITRGDLAKMLWPGLNKIFGQEYAEHPVIYERLFKKFTSTKAYEEEVGLTGLGLVPIKTEGSPVLMDSMAQGYIKRYTHVTYASGFKVTMEAAEDNQYQLTQQMMRSPRALAYSIRQTKETIAANIFNRGFTSTYPGADSLELFSLLHTNGGGNGGTYQNELTTAADLSEAALEQASIDMGAWTNDRGLKISAQITALVVPVALKFEAYRITKSVLRPGTANNDPNALHAMGTVPEIIVSPYLTDSDAWFLLTDVPDGLKYFERKGDTFEIDNEFLTMDAIYTGHFRCSFGWTDPKGAFGSSGA
ncbi:MAG: hypothetical protein C4542_08135 [Dehalococcoidia bacterium]|nr:MAG: hypothetical protein C4542_08135 [Dehalococcoidia bacterium]